MKNKILLLGATGMAGHMIYYYLRNTNKYDIRNVTYRLPLTPDSIILDVTNLDAIQNVIYEEKPDIIINCIGLLIKEANKFPDKAVFLNAYFPQFLREKSDSIGCRLIHISTDCVFSGKKGKYKEEDFRDADDIYGRSKALGEIVNTKDLTIRTSIIGPELKKNGEGLFSWFIKQKGEIKGYTAAFWGGVTTLELAKAIDAAIEDKIVGLVHLTNGIRISKYDLLTLIKVIWDKQDIIIKPCEDYNIDKSLVRSERFNYIVPSYFDMLKELHIWMLKNNLYANQIK